MVGLVGSELLEGWEKLMIILIFPLTLPQNEAETEYGDRICLEVPRVERVPVHLAGSLLERLDFLNNPGASNA